MHTVWIGLKPEDIEWYFSGGGNVITTPMRQFSRYNSDGQKICRWFLCSQKPKHPYREFCGEECSIKFENWYWRMYETYFSWNAVKHFVWKRDEGKCQICSIELIDNGNPWGPKSPEYDHIIEKYTAMFELNYEPQSFAYLRDILLNRANVRLLCHPCHRKITGQFNSKRWEKIRKIKAATPKPMQEQLLKYLEVG